MALPLGGVDLNMLPQRMMHSINAFPLMAIPLFMLAGELMLRGEIAERMIEFANAFVGRVAGGLAQATILAGASLSSVSGAAVADASALGTLLVRELTKVYGVAFAAAIIAAAAAILGPIIPPSNAMIVYAYMAGSSVSVAGLFMAGVVPGIVLTIGMMVMVHVIAKRRGYPLTGEPVTRASIAREMSPLVGDPADAGGGHRRHRGRRVSRPPRAAAIAVVYALVVGLLRYTQAEAAGSAGMPADGGHHHGDRGRLIAFASAVTFLMTVDLLPARLASASSRTPPTPGLQSPGGGPAVRRRHGMESNAAYIMLVPLLHPIALAYGLDPLHFGFLFVFNLVLGMLTPPVGVVLFVVCSIANITMGQIMRQVWPFVVFGYGLLILCIFWPPLVTGLPRALGY